MCQKGASFFWRKAQIMGMQFMQLVPRPKPNQGERWVSTGNEHNMQRWRQMIEKKCQRFMNARICDDVIIFQYQQACITVSQRIEKCCKDRFQWWQGERWL
ncbi:hypothetical protein KTH_49180 [Thermosporothrix hazakensis]|nr:hypothetical protein KTH_49180 [Thermosporothrix hazakensis]